MVITRHGWGRMMGGKSKMKKVMDEWKSGTLHFGSKKGPKVKSQKQAIAIALSEAGLSKKNPAEPYGIKGCFSANGRMGRLNA